MSGTKNSLSNLILLTLEKSVDSYARIEDFIYHTHIYAGGYERNLTKKSLAQAFKRLREKGLVDFIPDDEIVLKLTSKGEGRLELIKLKTQEENWDGKWRIVFFDIPERRRNLRDVFRNQLKQFGFIQRQKSVWVSKKNCTQLLKKYIKNIGIKDWVMLVESDSINL